MGAGDDVLVKEVVEPATRQRAVPQVVVGLEERGKVEYAFVRSGACKAEDARGRVRVRACSPEHTRAPRALGPLTSQKSPLKTYTSLSGDLMTRSLLVTREHSVPESGMNCPPARLPATAVLPRVRLHARTRTTFTI